MATKQQWGEFRKGMGEERGEREVRVERGEGEERERGKEDKFSCQRPNTTQIQTSWLSRGRHYTVSEVLTVEKAFMTQELLNCLTKCCGRRVHSIIPRRNLPHCLHYTPPFQLFTLSPVSPCRVSFLTVYILFFYPLLTLPHFFRPLL